VPLVETVGSPLSVGLATPDATSVLTSLSRFPNHSVLGASVLRTQSIPSLLVAPDDAAEVSKECPQDLLNEAHGEDSSNDEYYGETGQLSTFNVRIIYFAFCLGVQMFLSYNGGATSASLDTIESQIASLTETQVGLLGSLDKVGQTASSMMWGRALQLFPTKFLLVCALITNAFFSLLFGLTSNKWLMFASKFLQGATEALQGVWGTVWTLSNAPPSKRTQWMGMGAIVAGIGNGIGTAVAGFTTANGLPYSIAYAIQASVLALLWVGMVCTPAWHLRITQQNESDSDDGDESELQKQPALKTIQQMKILWSNRIYTRTVLCIALIFFFNSGAQFIWTRMFVEGPWGLNKNYVVIAFLVVTGLGSAIGVLLGPSIVDRFGGYADDLGRYNSLKILRAFSFVAAIAATIAIFAVSMRMHLGKKRTMACPWLWILWLAIMVVYMSVNGMVAALTAINCECTGLEVRAFATGATVSIQNLLGYAAGALLPGVEMDVVDGLCRRFLGRNISSEAKLGNGFIFICTAPFLLAASVTLASQAARLELSRDVDSKSTSDEAASDEELE